MTVNGEQLRLMPQQGNHLLNAEPLAVQGFKPGIHRIQKMQVFRIIELHAPFRLLPAARREQIEQFVPFRVFVEVKRYMLMHGCFTHITIHLGKQRQRKDLHVLTHWPSQGPAAIADHIHVMRQKSFHAQIDDMRVGQRAIAGDFHHQIASHETVRFYHAVQHIVFAATKTGYTVSGAPLREDIIASTRARCHNDIIQGTAHAQTAYQTLQCRFPMNIHQHFARQAR